VARATTHADRNMLTITKLQQQDRSSEQDSEILTDSWNLEV